MKKFAIASVLMAILISAVAYASYISLTTTIDNVVIGENGTGKASIRILNSGDEAAHNVELMVLLPEGFSSNTIYAGKILPNSTFNGNFTVSVIKNMSILPGSYAACELTRYQDANGYQFSSISPLTITHINPTSSKITGLLDSVTIGEKGSKSIKLKLINSDSSGHDVYVRLFLPSELTCREPEKSIYMQKNSENSITFEVSNAGALIGSNYVVFASIDYSDGMHYSSFARGNIEITKEEPFNYTLPMAIILILLILAIVFVNVRHRFSR